MSINGHEVITAEIGFRAKVNLKGAEQLNIDMWDGSISFVKYVAKNTVLDKSDTDSVTFMKFIKFVEHMLLFGSTDGNKYIGHSDIRGNDLLRPDCYFELRDNRIKSLADRTSKALKQAHNLQKMYKAQLENFIMLNKMVGVVNSVPLFLLEYFKEDFWNQVM